MNYKLKGMHDDVIEKYKKMYDDNEALLITELKKDYGYHSKLNNMIVHLVTNSTDFAVGLLDGGKEEDVTIAEKIISRIISLQDKRADKDTFGLWQYYLEESIDEMSPPDWNMAAFNAMSLLQVYIDYRDKLKKETVDAIKQACIDASKCIIKRNVVVSYTNIAAMSSYVTLITGELFDDEIKEYGQNYFKKFYYRTKYNGYFDEYNSPTYSILLVKILGFMLKHIKDKEMLKMVEDLNDIAWKMIAEHFHPNTGEWIGPQFRAYSDFIDDSVRTLIEAALDFKINLTDNKVIGLLDMRADVKCPEKYMNYFLDGTKCYSIRRMISPGFTYPYVGHPWGEMNYITPEYTLSTYDRLVLWNQHRPLIMYTGNKQNKSCIRLRLLHDFYDFSAGYITTAQYENALISQINYITDGGDKHTSLDLIKDATIHVKDFRYRVQVTGNPKSVKIVQDDSEALINVDGVQIRCGFAYMAFGNHSVRYEVNSDEKGTYFDAVLADSEQDICFKDMEEAVSVFYMTVNSEECGKPQCRTNGDVLETEWQAEGNSYRLTTCKAPGAFHDIIFKHKQYLNGEWIEKLEAEKPIG